VGIVTTLTVAVAAKLIADEMKASAPSITRHVLRTAVAVLPEDLRTRLNEEWAADLQSTPGDIAPLLRATGLLWAAVQIRFATRTLSRFRSTEPVPVPTTFLESMGQAIVNVCTEKELKALREWWEKPDDKACRKAAESALNRAAERLERIRATEKR
jgi:hypothetical protein